MVVLLSDWNGFDDSYAIHLNHLKERLIEYYPYDLRITCSPVDEVFGGPNVYVYLLEQNIGFEFGRIDAISADHLAHSVRMALPESYWEKKIKDPRFRQDDS